MVLVVATMDLMELVRMRRCGCGGADEERGERDAGLRAWRWWAAFRSTLYAVHESLGIN